MLQNTEPHINYPTKSSKRGTWQDCISIAGFEQGCVLNKDGSIAVGFEYTAPEEESLSSDAFASLIDAWSAAAYRLPVGTVIQKLDIYWAEAFSIDVPHQAPFFYRKALTHHHGKTLLKHRCVLFLHFFGKELNPVNTFLGLGNAIFKDFIADLPARKKEVERACLEFTSAMPTGIKLRRLTDADHETLLYQYAGLAFHRAPIGFECNLSAQPDHLAMGVCLKSVAMTDQAEEVYCAGRNHFGAHGVTAPFTWPIGHFARFPHITCQHIALINDKAFRKEKSRELEFSAQLKLQASSKELAEHMQSKFSTMEKVLSERDTRLARLSLQVFLWHADKEALQTRVDQIKTAFSRVGIGAAEEGEETISTFLSAVPGGTGFLEGCYMPIETAVSYLQHCTPRQGDTTGIVLQDRHGTPIYYDPFKYSLDNQHVFLFGPSGSGKSFFNGKMIKDRYYAGHTVVVIDSGGTYRFLFKALGGKYIEYNPDSPLRLNPFLVKKKDGKYKPDTDKVAFLVNFLAKMWKGDLNKNSLTEAEYALLSKFLTLYYEALDAAAIPNLVGFCAWLKGHLRTADVSPTIFDAANFLIVLEPFTEGIYKDHFNAFEVEHLEESRLLCFELEAVKNDRKLYPLVVQVLFDYVLQLVATQPDQKKFIDIEEGWTMLDDTSESYIESFFRKGRKTNTAIRIITQSVSEIRDSRIAGAMKNNAATFILLYNDKASVREEIADFLGMNEFDMEKYASLRRYDSYVGGYREVFIKEMDKSSVWRLGMSLYEHAILTSRPDERNAILAMTAQHGDLQRAVTDWVERIKKQTNRTLCTK